MSDPKDIAKLGVDFIESPYGKHFVTWLNYTYNMLHQQAEAEELTSEQKAYKIERAAGVKTVISYLTTTKEINSLKEAQEKKDS